MSSYGARVRQVFVQFVLAAAVAGPLDAIVTLAIEGDRVSPDVAEGAAVAIVGFDALMFVVLGLLVGIVAAYLAPATTSEPRPEIVRLFRGFWPRDPAIRKAAGAALLLAGVTAGAFVGVTDLLALVLIESIRTPSYAATAVTLVALAVGTLCLLLGRAAIVRTQALLSTSRAAQRLVFWLSPAAVVGLALLAVAGVFAWRWDNVTEIVEATPLRPWIVAAVGILGVACAGLLPPVTRWSRSVRAVVVVLLPAMLLGASLATVFWIGEDNETRILFTTHGQISPWAYQGFKKVFDGDGDGRLSFMGENDCDPDDPTIYAGAPEIPNNGIDEDCDGVDLDLTFPSQSARPRWDFPVPENVPRRPNVVVISIDAVAPAHMSAYGYHRPTTPFLDSLAWQSVWFTNAFSQGPSTRLAVPALFTSRFDSQILTATGPKIPHEILPGNVTWAEVMRSAGYRTIAVLPTAYFRDWKGLTQGFDVVNAEAADAYVAPVFHNASVVTDTALATLANAATPPVFLWVHYYDPHAPYTRPPGDDSPDFGDGEDDIYDSELAYTDAEIRRFVDGLGKILPPERTILIVTGDHGESFDAAHPKRHHGFDLHSAVLKLPLIIRTPFTQPRRIDMPVSSMDLLPTIVNLARIPGAFAFEGTSLLPQMLGAAPDEKRMIFHQFYLPENVYHRKPPLREVAIRTATLVLSLDMTNNTAELYRYQQDPGEEENMLENMPEAAGILRQELVRWLAKVAH